CLAHRVFLSWVSLPRPILEHEVLGHLLAPLLPARGPLEGVERAVHLDRPELRGGVLQLAPLRQVGGVEVAAPRRVAPPRDPHPDRHRCLSTRDTSMLHPTTVSTPPSALGSSNQIP